MRSFQQRHEGSLEAVSVQSAMAKKLAAATSVVSAAERDVLLATKLHVPGSRLGLVPRPRLAEALEEGLSRGLVPRPRS